ncbi:Retrovirus-related Pol polyprotein from type-1 retrotransposable element R1 2 [Eumeta japonica]|uniref:Retrovirus-related Pol polyprotein from type-1 retrotransposable element R1 2 n=1 Tax=Eumeta variegata TaxID=151549 RepID=A0A4C2A6G9_EUMVA|nr:Retrovirus-related Pol polyprotein from type-1 retrotransposable element R1 2 [Eumeta japonica]
MRSLGLDGREERSLVATVDIRNASTNWDCIMRALKGKKKHPEIPVRARIQETWRKAGPVYRLSALRVTSAFRIISEEAVCVISGILPLRVLTEERQTLHRRKRSSTLSAEELREEERQSSTSRWQLQWDVAKKGRWTHCLIRQIDVWLNRNHGEVNYYLTQMLLGHGCFRAYFHHFKRDDSSECPSCPGQPEDAEHVFFRMAPFQPAT